MAGCARSSFTCGFADDLDVVLGVEQRAELVRYAIPNGLLDETDAPRP